MSQSVYVLNGPNLNLLGKREPHIYGSETLADVEAACRKLCAELGLTLKFAQSNAEHQLIDWIHEAREQGAAVIINAGAYTHTSIALYDALKALATPVLEVHISNIHARESFRHQSYISMVATGIVMGCGAQGYLLALQRVATLLGQARTKG